MPTSRRLMAIVALLGGLALAGVVSAGVPATKVHKPTGDKIQVESGGEIELKSGATLDLQSGSTITNAATLTQSGTLTATGDVNLGDTAADTVTVNGALDVASSSAAVDATWGLNFSTSTDGGGTSILFLDGANKRVGVNTKTPSAPLEVAGDVAITGTTPAVTVGDGGEEDAQVNFNGAAQDYHIGLDDTDDSLKIGLGTALGTTPAITIPSTLSVTASTAFCVGTACWYPPNAAPRTNVTPAGPGSMIWNSADAEMCISTGPVATSWVLQTDGSTACSH